MVAPAGAIPCSLVVVTATNRAAATYQHWERYKLISDEPRRGGGGDRKATASRPQARFPCNLVMVTVADKAATTYLHWERCKLISGDPKVSKGRSESPLVAPAGAIPLHTANKNL